MKKLTLSLFIIFTFAGFGLYRRLGLSNGNAIYVAPTTTPSQVATSPVVAPVPAPKKLGPYTDGQYIGSVADAYYGNVQVEAIIQNGQIVDVKFLQYPNDRNTSRYINSQAMPYLTQEAIQTQNTNVNIISGATDTSSAFRESLASALTKAQ
jgi:uncharacterized protein with FMN-binding domain